MGAPTSGTIQAKLEFPEYRLNPGRAQRQAAMVPDEPSIAKRDTTGAKPATVEVLPPKADTTADTKLIGLALEIRTAIDDYKSYSIGRMEAVIRVGEKLQEAKKIAGHSHFLGWVATNCDLGERSVQDYLRVYEHRELLRSKYAAGAADFSIRSALQLLVKPKTDNASVSAQPALSADGRPKIADKDKLIAKLQDENAALSNIIAKQKPEAQIAAGPVAVASATIKPQQASEEDLFARRRRQLADLREAWERADSAVRAPFFREIKLEMDARELAEGELA